LKIYNYCPAFQTYVQVVLTGICLINHYSSF